MPEIGTSTTDLCWNGVQILQKSVARDLQNAKSKSRKINERRATSNRSHGVGSLSEWARNQPPIAGRWSHSLSALCGMRLGAMSLKAVKPVHVLRIIEARRSTPNTAEMVRTVIQQVFNYAIQKLKAETNPALPLRGMIEVPRAVHHRHLDEHELGEFWRSLEKQGAHFVTIVAAKLLFYSMLRKSEVLRAKWTEFDLERGIWDVPADRMKMRSSHRVHLSRQAKELLEMLWAMDTRKDYVFPSILRPGTHLGDATLNHLFGRLDFGVVGFSPHGTRSTAATLLREHGFSREVVELLLAHAERGSAMPYHRHQLGEERRRALQYLADEIDRLSQASIRAHINQSSARGE